MTAEIALMNKKAIALATDSAVTIGNGDKKYNSENKLFMLSKYYPVGIMIYSNSEFMGIPWETIIKSYRNQLGSTSFDSIDKYAENFIDYIKKDELNFEFAEKDYLCNVLVNYIIALNNAIDIICKDTIKNLGRDLSESEISSIIDVKIEELYNNFNSYQRLEDITSDCEEYIIEKCDRLLIDILKTNNINHLKISDSSLKKLKNVSVELFTKDFFNVYSGIVIAGFGEKDVFPGIVSYTIGGKINGCIKYKIDNDKTDKITLDRECKIIPFAQDDVVMTFMQGIDSKYINVINDFFNQTISDSVNNIKSDYLMPFQKEKVITELKSSWELLLGKIRKYSTDNYIIPILRAIQVSPKDELASMAEALVNITSFKRQVVMDNYSGTVGGPIDVAIISKGDGFVWVKRKHYFKPEFNHQFFDNYYNNYKKENNNEKG